MVYEFLNMAKANGGDIYFHFLTRPFFFPKRNDLKYYVKLILRDSGKSLDTINYIFCSDDYLLKLNKTHLKHNTLTDIITFELSPKNAPLIADIFISVERVKYNATSFGIPFTEELRRVIFHGALHLCGFKDKKPADIIKMRRAEEYHLKRFMFHVKQTG